MEYGIVAKTEILDKGEHLGFEYYILNLGTHPTAYVQIPKGHPCFELYRDSINIYVHGGLTYAKKYLVINNNEPIKGWFIGWDYAHYGDYTGFDEMYPIEFRAGGKKWTTKEIQEDVFEVCKQLKEMEK